MLVIGSSESSSDTNDVVRYKCSRGRSKEGGRKGAVTKATMLEWGADLHDLLLILFQDVLKVFDFIALVRHHQIIHRRDLRILLVGLDLLHEAITPFITRGFHNRQGTS